MTALDVLLCLIFAFSLPVGQILFKFAAASGARVQGSFVDKIIGSPIIILAFGSYALGSLLWYYILLRLPLTTAYIFSILGTGFVPLAAWLFFGEQISLRYALGYGIMLLGFYVAVSSRV